MRIAIIAPRHPEPAAQELEQTIRRCADASRTVGAAMQARGHEVTTLELSDDDPEAELNLAKLVQHADAFDLVHTWAGYRTLLQLAAIPVPLVATVAPALIARAPQVYRHFQDRVHYVSTASGAEGLRQAGVIPWDREDDPQAVTAALEELYRVLIARAARLDRRPWGYYVILADEPDHKVKRIVVYPGKRLSLQKHRKRSEHWFILSGEALVTRDEEVLRLAAGHGVEIPLGAWHRIQNPTSTELAFIEVQTGEYFGEDDIQRKEDDFGRA